MVNDVSGLRDRTARRGLRPDGRGAGAHAHARGAEGDAAGARTPTTTSSPTSWASCASAWRSRVAAGVGEEQIVLDPGPGLRQDAGADGRGAAAARRAGGARAAAAAGGLAQGLPRRDHRPRAARARGGDARGASSSGVRAGASILRVHDVAAAADFLAVRAVLRGRARARSGRGPDAGPLPRALAFSGQVAGRCHNAAGCRPTHTEGRDPCLPCSTAPRSRSPRSPISTCSPTSSASTASAASARPT